MTSQKIQILTSCVLHTKKITCVRENVHHRKKKFSARRLTTFASNLIHLLRYSKNFFHQIENFLLKFNFSYPCISKTLKGNPTKPSQTKICLPVRKYYLIQISHVHTHLLSLEKMSSTKTTKKIKPFFVFFEIYHQGIEN